jgi:hypothetical protein
MSTSCWEDLVFLLKSRIFWVRDEAWLPAWQIWKILL